MVHRHAGFRLTAAALLLALTACTFAEDEADDPVADDPVPEAADAATDAEPEPDPQEEADPYEHMDAELSERLHLPLYDYQLDAYEMYVVGLAEQVLAVDCMTGLGYEARINAESAFDRDRMRFFGPHGEYRRYRMVRVDVAESHGMEVPEEPRVEALRFDEADADPWAAYMDGGDHIETPSGEGVPDGGCLAQARRDIDPDLPTHSGEDPLALESREVPGYNELAENLLGESFTAALDDPSVVAAEAAWQVCMAENGYPGERLWGIGDTGSAIAPNDTDGVAASAECLDSSGYIDAAASVETSLQETMIAEHESALTDRREQVERDLETAQEILDW